MRWLSVAMDGWTTVSAADVASGSEKSASREALSGVVSFNIE